MDIKILGLSCQPFKWTQTARVLAEFTIEERRLVFQLHEDEIKGRRYDSDHHVLNLLMSSCCEEDYAKDVDAWTDAALHAAARADHWYNSEKDYGDPREEEEEPEDVDPEE